MPQPLIAVPAVVLPQEFIAALQRAEAGDNKDFIELGYFPDPDGVIARVTAKKDNGTLSACIRRVFAVGNENKTGAYFGHRHLDGVRRLLNLLDQHLPLMEDQERMRILSGRA